MIANKGGWQRYISWSHKVSQCHWGSGQPVQKTARYSSGSSAARDIAIKVLEEGLRAIDGQETPRGKHGPESLV